MPPIINITLSLISSYMFDKTGEVDTAFFKMGGKKLFDCIKTLRTTGPVEWYFLSLIVNETESQGYKEWRK